MHIGGGQLLSRESYSAQLDPHIGFGRPVAGCAQCRTLGRLYGYGLGVVRLRRLQTSEVHSGRIGQDRVDVELLADVVAARH